MINLTDCGLDIIEGDKTTENHPENTIFLLLSTETFQKIREVVRLPVSLITELSFYKTTCRYVKTLHNFLFNY